MTQAIPLREPPIPQGRFLSYDFCALRQIAVFSPTFFLREGATAAATAHGRPIGSATQFILT